MSKTYPSCDTDQSYYTDEQSVLPAALSEWLPSDDLAYFVSEVVGQMDFRTSSPTWDGERQAELKAAVQGLPSQAGIDSSNWNWKAVRRYVRHRFGLALSRSSCLNHPHRLGFVLKRYKKRLRKGGPSAAVSFYGGVSRADGSGATDVSQDMLRRRGPFPSRWRLEGQWVLKGEPALVDSNRTAIGRLKMGSRCNSHANDRARLRPPEHRPQGLVAEPSQELTHSQTIHRTLPHRLFPTQIQHYAHWHTGVGQ